MNDRKCIGGGGCLETNGKKHHFSIGVFLSNFYCFKWRIQNPDVCTFGFGFEHLMHRIGFAGIQLVGVVKRDIGEQAPEAEREDGSRFTFAVRSRLDTPIDVRYYQNGGILHTVLRDLLAKSAKA